MIKLVLIASGLALSNHRVGEQLVYIVQKGSWFSLAVFCGIWAISLLAVLYTAFTPREGWRLVWTIVIGMSTLLGDTLYRFSGSHLTIARLDEMLSTAGVAAQNQVTNPDIANVGLTDSLDTPLALAMISTLLLVSGLLLKSAYLRRLKNGWLGLYPALPVALSAALAVYVGADRGRELRAMPSQFATAGVLAAYSLSPAYSTEKQTPVIQQVQTAAVHNVLLIVDESVSGDFIDPNRRRGTTPYLASHGSAYVNFGLALAAHNCSEGSNTILRLGANPGQIGNASDRIINNPSIWKYAAMAGFETTYITAQFDPGEHRYHMNEVELSLIDHIEKSGSCQPMYLYDLASLEILTKALSRDRPQFILLVKLGPHTPYTDSYPMSETVFRPAMGAGEKIVDRTRLVNSYKNAIRWNVDHFFAQLFENVELEDFVLIYTSDHGQNLLDDGSPSTHCRRVGQTLPEALVPLLVWSDQPETMQRFKRGAQMNYNSASHFQVFPTLLDLFGFAPEEIRTTYYDSLFDEVDDPLGFVSGPIMGRFGSRSQWNSRQGMEDFSR